MNAAGGVVLFGILSAACSRNTGGETVTFWALGAEGERVAAMLPEFEQRYPGIKVNVQMIPWNAAHEKLLTAFAGGSLPDMCQLGNTWIPEFHTLDAIEDLTPWVKTSVEVRDSSYFPGIWQTNVMDSCLFGLPWYVDTRVMFYRTDRLARAGYSHAPRSWAEWRDVSARLKALDPQNFAMFFSTNNEWAPQVIMGMQKGSTLLRDNDTRGYFSGPEFESATEAFHEFFTRQWAPVKTTQIVNIYQAFAEGIFSMYISGPWNVGEFRRRLPDSLRGAWMTAPLPGPDGGVGVSLAGGSSLVMFKTSQRKAAVWKLMEYLSEPKQQLALYRSTGDLPARVEAWRDTALTSNAYMIAFFEQLQHVRPTPKIPEWEQIAQKVREDTELISMDQMSVRQGVERLDRDVDVILEKRRWMVGAR
jgi:multiple sugar transport system substrate-binding protein